MTFVVKALSAAQFLLMSITELMREVMLLDITATEASSPIFLAVLSENYFESRYFRTTGLRLMG